MLRPIKIIKKSWVYVLDTLILTALILCIFSSFKRVNQRVNVPTAPPVVQDTDNEPLQELRGIDVSHYQGMVDWQQVADSYHFAFIKATEGDRYQDPAFTRNLDSILGTAMEFGAYHFFTPDKDASAQAKHFLSTIEGFEYSLPPVLDVEVAPDGSMDIFQEAIEQWIGMVKTSTGCTPIIYTNRLFWDRYLKNRFEGFPVWISDYTKDDDKLASISWSFWQFTDSGSVEGISGPVDESRYRGSETNLKQLGSCEV